MRAFSIFCYSRANDFGGIRDHATVFSLFFHICLHLRQDLLEELAGTLRCRASGVLAILARLITYRNTRLFIFFLLYLSPNL